MKCPCCGQPYPLEAGELTFIDQYRLVSDGVTEVILTPKQYKILTGIRQRTRTLDELVEWVYGDDPNGGPVSAKNVIAVQICRLNERLAPLGIRAGAQRKGAWAPPYAIENVARQTA